jgi:D-glycero-D-manno-heptose 1,7-bisphosphate phosphatase
MKKSVRIVFLDRDGVINRYPGDGLYITRLKDLKMIKGSLEAIKKLTKAGFLLFVISNQAGVTKGLYSKRALKDMTRYILTEVRKHGGRIHKVFYCLHTKEQKCSCRKPKIGLLKKAVSGRPRVDLKNSYFIGDSMIDVKTGKKFGCKTVLVLTGREKLKNAPQWDTTPDFVARTLFDAAKHIIAHKYERA